MRRRRIPAGLSRQCTSIDPPPVAAWDDWPMVESFLYVIPCPVRLCRYDSPRRHRSSREATPWRSAKRAPNASTRRVAMRTREDVEDVISNTPRATHNRSGRRHWYESTCNGSPVSNATSYCGAHRIQRKVRELVCVVRSIRRVNCACASLARTNSSTSRRVGLPMMCWRQRLVPSGTGRAR